MDKETKNKKEEEIEKIKNELAEKFEQIKAEILNRGKEVYNSLEYDDRLALVAYIFSILHQHAIEGGSFRCLIYNRLGFDLDAYLILHLSGGLDLANMLYNWRKIGVSGE